MAPSQASFFNKVKTELSAIHLKSFFSLSPFKNVAEGLLVTASYSVAAIFIPQVINLALGSIMGLVALGGLIAACYGGYKWYKLSKMDDATEQDINQMKNLTYIGGGALMLSMTLAFSTIVLPLLLSAVVGHRTLSAFTEQDWQKAKQISSAFGLSSSKPE